jgi:hypothetical protein
MVLRCYSTTINSPRLAIMDSFLCIRVVLEATDRAETKII